MRAISGAIIAAGALIGLGLASIGVGTRYQQFYVHAAAAAGGGETATTPYIRFSTLDTPLAFALILLTAGLAIGIGVTFVGLAYHHERRHWERHRHLAPGTAGIGSP